MLHRPSGQRRRDPEAPRSGVAGSGVDPYAEGLDSLAVAAVALRCVAGLVVFSTGLLAGIAAMLGSRLDERRLGMLLALHVVLWCVTFELRLLFSRELRRRTGVGR